MGNRWGQSVVKADTWVTHEEGRPSALKPEESELLFKIKQKTSGLKVREASPRCDMELFRLRENPLTEEEMV